MNDPQAQCTHARLVRTGVRDERGHQHQCETCEVPPFFVPTLATPEVRAQPCPGVEIRCSISDGKLHHVGHCCPGCANARQLAEENARLKEQLAVERQARGWKNDVVISHGECSCLMCEIADSRAENERQAAEIAAVRKLIPIWMEESTGDNTKLRDIEAALNYAVSHEPFDYVEAAREIRRILKSGAAEERPSDTLTDRLWIDERAALDALLSLLAAPTWRPPGRTSMQILSRALERLAPRPAASPKEETRG